MLLFRLTSSEEGRMYWEMRAARAARGTVQAVPQTEPRGRAAEGSRATLLLRPHTTTTHDSVTALHLLPLSLLPEPVTAGDNLDINVRRNC